MQKVILVAGVGAVAAGSIEVVSSDLTSGNRALDNIKAKWSQSLNVLGNDATLTGSYDRKERSDFLKECSLSGAVSKIKYELTSKFDGATGLKLETTTDDGTTVEAEGSLDRLVSVPRITKLTAARAANLRGTDCNLEMSHQPADGESKLKLSTMLGSGVKAIATLTSKGGDASTSYEVEYDTQLTEGRSLSASVNPQDGSGEIEYVDNASVDGTLTATIPLGGQPKLTLSRAFKF